MVGLVFLRDMDLSFFFLDMKVNKHERVMEEKKKINQQKENYNFKIKQIKY